MLPVSDCDTSKNVRLSARPLGPFGLGAVAEARRDGELPGAADRGPAHHAARRAQEDGARAPAAAGAPRAPAGADLPAGTARRASGQLVDARTTVFLKILLIQFFVFMQRETG